MAESVQNLKKRIKSIGNIKNTTKALDMVFGFDIMKRIKHTAFSACRDGSFSL